MYFQSAVLSRFKNKLGAAFNTIDSNYVDNNLLRVEVFFKDFTSSDIAETPAYPVRLAINFEMFDVRLSHEIKRLLRILLFKLISQLIAIRVQFELDSTRYEPTRRIRARSV